MKQLAILLVLALGLTGMSAVAHAEAILIRGGQIHTITNGILEHGDVLIGADGRIAEIGQGLTPPEDARIVEADGRPVTPGFMAAHTHLGLVEVLAEESTDDRDVPGGDPGTGPALDVAPAFNPDSTLIPVTRMEGVTRAVVAPLPSGAMFSGQGGLAVLGASPAIFQERAAIYLELGEDGADLEGGSRMKVWETLIGALEEVRGVGRTPIMPANKHYSDYELTRRDHDAFKRVARGQIPLVIRAHRAADIRQALALKADQEVDIIILGGAEAWREAEALAAAQVPVIIDPIFNLPRAFETLGATLANAARLEEAGVDIAFYVSRFSSHNARNVNQLAGNAVANGLTRETALRALTLTPAEMFGVADVYGSLEVGKAGDLVVWDADPLEVTSAPVFLAIDGEAIALTSRQSELAQRYKARLDGEGRYGYQ